MRLDPHRLLVLRAVWEYGGVTAAARQLQMAPSGISQHLAALEREVGQVLVDRSRQGGQRALALTVVGRRLAEHGVQLAQVLDAAAAEIIELSGQQQGQVALAAFPTAIRHIAAPAIEHIAAQHPGVEVQLVELDDRPAAAALHSGEIDLALIEEAAQATTNDAQAIALEPLLRDPFHLAVPATWQPLDSVDGLGHWPWISGRSQSVTARLLQQWRSMTGQPFRARHVCREYPAILDLVGAGAGAALIPSLAVSDTADDRVKLHNLPHLGARVIFLGSLARRRQLPAIEVIAQALREGARATARSGERELRARPVELL